MKADLHPAIAAFAVANVDEIEGTGASHFFLLTVRKTSMSRSIILIIPSFKVKATSVLLHGFELAALRVDGPLRRDTASAVRPCFSNSLSVFAGADGGR
jgi:hypothetical protein